MEEMKSPPSTCPYTVTARRNPRRKARPTPATDAPSPPDVSTSNIAQTISSFPLDDILSIQVAKDVQSVPTSSPLLIDNLNVFLRIRPLKPLQTLRKVGESKLLPRTKNCWPQNPATKNVVKEKKIVKKNEVCVVVNDDLRSVTLSPPLVLQDAKKMKTEVYEGFSHVFSADSTQGEVYERMVNPLVEDFLRGKSGMLAALGPSGSGKTHTVFGCVRDPGMVPLILHKIFKHTEGTSFEPPRIFYLSVFEICSEKGKGERIIDLFPDSGDIFISHSGIKGLKELHIRDRAEAEALIACALMKRATATTNTNSQSSRSQCIINIRYDLNAWNQEDNTRADNAVLTIVDLAGAEREKRTGNQGARLLESNFINNTSMVFGLCLRSLLEHQKNPKKKFQKHFQNSLLTRYLRDYLEGKKRMTLILTVKPGEEDYLDTSHLLRQASPYMKIKFDLVEKSSTFPSNKRQFQPFLKSELHKRVKVNILEDCEIEEQKIEDPNSIEEMLPEMLKSNEALIASHQSPEILHSDPCFNKDCSSEDNSQSIGRNNQIMQSFAKAIWNVLKEYRDKLRVAESELCSLRIENARCVKFEKELRELKSRCSCSSGTSVNGSPTHTIPESRDENSSVEGDTKTLHESNGDMFSIHPVVSDRSEQPIACYSPVGNDQLIHLQFSDDKHGSYLENIEDFAEDSNPLNICGGEYVFSVVKETGLADGRLAGVVESSSSHIEVSNGSPLTTEHTNIRHTETLKETEHADVLNTFPRDDTFCNVEVTELDEIAEISSELCVDGAEKSSRWLVETVEDCNALKVCGGEDEDGITIVEKTGVIGYCLAEFVESSSLPLIEVGNVSRSTAEAEQQNTEFNVSTNKRHTETMKETTELSAVLDTSTSEDVFSNVVEASIKKNTTCLHTDVKTSTGLAEVSEISSELLADVAEGSSQSLLELSSDNLSKVKVEQQNTELSEKFLDLPQSSLKGQTITEELKDGNIQESDQKLNTFCKPVVGKPKRKLLPASSTLLRDVTCLDFNDENARPKGNRSQKKLGGDEIYRTQGSMTLLRLLQSNLRL